MTAGAVIAARVAEWGVDDLPLERALFGTADPHTIAAVVDAQCRELLGSGIVRYEFFESSAGSVHGVTLTDRHHRPREMGAFIDDYEAARGRPFTAGERTVLAASMVASLAYGARCEHADPLEPPDGDDCQRALLARVGNALLDEGLDALRRA